MGNEDQPEVREIPHAARATAAIAVSGPNDWTEAKSLNQDDLFLQAEVYADAAQRRLREILAGSPEERALFLGLFSSAFVMGFTVMEQRTLKGGDNPLLADMKKIADAGRDATPNQLRQVARLALMREGLE